MHVDKAYSNRCTSRVIMWPRYMCVGHLGDSAGLFAVHQAILVGMCPSRNCLPVYNLQIHYCAYSWCLIAGERALRATLVRNFYLISKLANLHLTNVLGLTSQPLMRAQQFLVDRISTASNIKVQLSCGTLLGIPCICVSTSSWI